MIENNLKKIKMVNKTNLDSLTEFIRICSSVFDISANDFKETALNLIKYYRGNSSYREKVANTCYLEERWYKSLKSNCPDYDVYRGTEILPDLWACWVIYSSNYIKRIISNRLKNRDGNFIIKDLKSIDKILDLGCGIGYTSAGLKELFPSADVFATNIKPSKQFKVCQVISQLYDFSLLKDFTVLDNVDLIFASEYFEHFRQPIDHLRQIIAKLSPRYLFIANSFKSRSLGHFDYFIEDGMYYDGGKISRIFNATLRKLGYVQMVTTCWNNRPSYWKKQT